MTGGIIRVSGSEIEIYNYGENQSIDYRSIHERNIKSNGH